MGSRASRQDGGLARLAALAMARETLAVVVAIGLSLAIITTIYSNIRSVEKALPQYGFLSFRTLHAHIRDIDRLKDMVLLARADPASAEGRELLAEAADLAHIRFASVDRTPMAADLDIHSGLRDTVLAIIETLDEMLARPQPLDQTTLRAVTAQLEAVELELNRYYYSVGEESSEGLHQAQSALRALNRQVLAILAVLSTLLIGIAILLVQRQRAERKLHKLAWQDAVTGLKNRAWLMEKSGKFIKDAKAAHQRLAIYLIDLDHFKQVNDTFGHQAGDDLLRAVADILKSHDIHRSAAAIRLGGDEFAFIKAAGSGQDLVRFGETLCEELSGFREVDGHQVMLAASIGLSFCPDHGGTVSELLRHADLALYAAKADGRQRAVTYSPALKVHLDNRVEMEESIRRGIENEEFFLVWQPQLAVSTGRLTGVEALLRWKNPKTGKIVSPPEFLPVAEKSDLILELDRLVLRQACRQAAAWIPRLADGFTLSVNVSGRQFEEPGFSAFLARVLKETCLPANILELDLTEQVFSHNRGAVLTALAAVRGMGVRTAADDFGTGYSSLGSIAELDIDRIKIDRSFLFELEDSPRKRGLVKSILTMCEALEMEALAKGVESADQLEFLAGTSCGYAQGFYICEPLSASLFSNYIREHGGNPADSRNTVTRGA